MSLLRANSGEAFLRLIDLTYTTVAKVDKTCRRLPGYDQVVDRIVDTILGSANALTR